MNEKPNYFAVIPASVRYDKSLNANAKLLYGEISSLCNKEGYCYATNKYFADLYDLSIRTITELIKLLVSSGHITSVMVYKEGTKEVIERRLYLVNKTSIPLEENFYTPLEKNFQDNNKELNNKENNNINIITKERFKKPTVEEVREYCKERHNNVNAQTFIDFYESKGWLVGKTPMKDWKACVRTWEKRTINASANVEPIWFEEAQDIKLISKQEQEEMEALINGLCNTI